MQFIAVVSNAIAMAQITPKPPHRGMTKNQNHEKNKNKTKRSEDLFALCTVAIEWYFLAFQLRLYYIHIDVGSISLRCAAS